MYQRIQQMALRRALEGKGLKVWHAFQKFDVAGDGLLSADEVYGAFAWLGLDMDVEDILALIEDAGDPDQDMNWTYTAFSQVVRSASDAAELTYTPSTDEGAQLQVASLEPGRTVWTPLPSASVQHSPPPLPV